MFTGLTSGGARRRASGVEDPSSTTTTSTAQDPPVSSGVPTWFGSESAPLFGVLHVPTGDIARGGIVICPPIGKEHVDTYRGLKLLAQELCDRGLAVLRFDYLGTGDSSMTQRSDSAIEDYRSSIVSAVAYLRTCGVQEIGLVGLRLGALLATQVAHTLEHVASLVVWDPVTDGRRYFREQRALYKMTVGDDLVDPGGGSILGVSFAAAATSVLKTMRLPAEMPSAKHVLLAVRSERAADPRLAQLAEAPNCTVVEAVGQENFVEPFSFVVDIPMGILAQITSWLDRVMPTHSFPVSPTIRHKAVVSGWGTKRPVVEMIDALGPNRLFAIRTSAVDLCVDPPTVLIHSTAAEHRIGSGRVWTESAREIAGLGFAVIRYDRRGTGETGLATTAFARIYSDVSKVDITDAIGASGAGPDRLIMTGICSGASNSAYGAIQLGARCVVLFNVILYSMLRVEVGPEKLLGMTPPPVAEAGKREPRTLSKVAKRLIRRWTPYRAWLLAGRLGLTQVPEVLLAHLQRKGVAVDLVLSPQDYEWFSKQRGPEGVSRLSRTGWSPNVVTAPTGDHPLLQRDLQMFARGRLIEAALREFPDRVLAMAFEGDVADAQGSTAGTG